MKTALLILLLALLTGCASHRDSITVDIPMPPVEYSDE